MTGPAERPAPDDLVAAPAVPAADLIDVVGRDHDSLTALSGKVKASWRESPGTPHRHQEAVAALRWELAARLSRHELAEEKYFWPAVRDCLDDGDHLRLVGLTQEREAKGVLKTLLGRRNEVRLSRAIEDVDNAFRRHIAFEDTVLSRISSATSEEERLQLGFQVARSLRRGPSRPHPTLPADPAFLIPGVPLLSAVDRLRDAVRLHRLAAVFPDDRPHRNGLPS